MNGSKFLLLSAMFFGPMQASLASEFKLEGTYVGPCQTTGFFPARASLVLENGEGKFNVEFFMDATCTTPLADVPSQPAEAFTYKVVEEGMLTFEFYQQGVKQGPGYILEAQKGSEKQTLCLFKDGDVYRSGLKQSNRNTWIDVLSYERKL